MSTAQLALPIAPRVLTPVRALRLALVFDNKALAGVYLAKHHEFHKNREGVLMQVRVRETAHGWMLVAWYSGRRYVLTRDNVLRPVRAGELG